MNPPSAPAPRILLIEDNVQNAYLARYLLENAGWSVDLAPNGGEGLALAETQRPDLILLDIQLPDMDGYTVASTLKGAGALREIPIVALSSFAMPGEKRRALEVGCSGYIEKPLQAMKFVDQVRAFLPKKGSPV